MEIAKIKIDGVTARVQYRCLVPAGLVGGTVTVEYSDPQWGGLTKTAVFKGNCVEDVVTNECVIRIPHETVAVPGENLQVGFYGTDSNGTLVIPTLWADLGVIQAAADPSDDVSTDPTLPVYTQLAQQIESLKDQIENIEPDGSGGNAGQSGLSTTAANLLVTILRNGVYTSDQSANIDALAAELSVTEPEVPDIPVEPDIPDIPEADVTQTGSILSIVSGVTATQTGSVLAIA